MSSENKRRVMAGVALLVAGLALVALYSVLAGFHVGKFGAPTDIGGGFLALAGYIVGAIGVLTLIKALLVCLGSRR